MKIRPSRGIFKPFGQPSYWTASSHSPFGSMRKILPRGISTHHRLPLRSNDGPSRKESTAAPARFGSDHAVRRFLRNFAGSEVKPRTSLFLISWNGLFMAGGVFPCNPPEYSAVCQARAPGIVEPEDAAYQLAGGIQAGNRRAVRAHHLRVGIDLQAAERERDAAGDRIGLEGRRIEGVRPVRFRNREAPRASSVLDVGVERNVGAHRAVVAFDFFQCIFMVDVVERAHQFLQ